MKQIFTVMVVAVFVLCCGDAANDSENNGDNDQVEWEHYEHVYVDHEEGTHIHILDAYEYDHTYRLNSGGKSYEAGVYDFEGGCAPLEEYEIESSRDSIDRTVFSVSAGVEVCLLLSVEGDIVEFEIERRVSL